MTKIKEYLKSIEEHPIWETLIIISILCSVFGPPIGIIFGASTKALLNIILYSNILFIFDTAIKIYTKSMKYIISVEFVIDISAIISGVLEYAFVLGSYTGPGIANLRLLRSLKIMSRFGRVVKSVIRFGKISRSTSGMIKRHKLPGGKSEDRYLNKIKSRIEGVIMIIMGYMVIRFSGSIDSLSGPEGACEAIFFFIEIIVLMFMIGGIVDYYLNKLIGERFRRIQRWIEEKSEKHGFFKDVNAKAYNESTDEVDYLQRYLGIVLDKAAEFPLSFRRFIWGYFKPGVQNRIVFISDIENYSGITDGMDAKQINSLLDDYINKAVDILIFYGAEVDKYVGDSIIAYFKPDQADYAIEASRNILALKFEEKLKTRIGLHHSKVIETLVGPYGYRQMDHLSEGISITQRIQEHNKDTKTYIQFSEEFYNLLSDDAKEWCRYLCEFRPRGSKKVVMAYTLKDSA